MGPHKNNPNENSAFDFEIVDVADFQEEAPVVEEAQANEKQAEPFKSSSVDLYTDKYKNLKFDRTKVVNGVKEFAQNNPEADELTLTEEMRKLVVRESLLYTRLQVWKNEHPDISDEDLETKKEELLGYMANGEDAVYNFYTRYSDPAGMDMLANFQKDNEKENRYRIFNRDKNIEYDFFITSILENGKNVEHCQTALNEFNKAFFAPKADGSDIKINVKSERIKGMINEWQQNIEAVEIPVPENLNDELITYAVLGEYYKPENLQQTHEFAKTVGGSTLYDNLGPEETAKMLLMTNVMSNDARINAQSVRAIISSCRENVKSYVESDNLHAIKENLKIAANELYISSFVKAKDGDEFSYSVNNLTSLMAACERSNISMDEIGMTPEKIERFKAMQLVQDVTVNKEKARADLQKAFAGFVNSKGKDSSCDPIKNPELKNKLLDYMAYKCIVNSITAEVNAEIINNRKCYLNDSAKQAERELSPTEKILSEKPYGCFKAFRDRIEKSEAFKQILKADYKEKVKLLSENFSVDSLYNRAVPFGDWKSYELNVADYDFAKRAKSIADFKIKADKDVQKHRDILAKEPNNRHSRQAVKAYDSLIKFENAFNEMLAFRQSEKEKGADFGDHEHAKMMAEKYRAVNESFLTYTSDNGNLRLCPDAAKFFLGEMDYFDSMAKYFDREATLVGVQNEIREAAYKVKSGPSLYSVNADSIKILKWGVTKNQHVAHFFDGDTKDMIVINPDEAPENNIYGMDQKSIYNTLSDKKTMENFRSLMQLSATEYEKPNIDKDYKNVLRAVKTYITAEKRSTQQDALIDLNKKLASYEKKHKGINSEALTQFKNTLSSITNGSLQPNQASLTGKDTTEPHDASLGYLGAWSKAEGALFPHEPSPNDIKQGIINDCFMLSALTKMAKDHPEKIKNAIRDNGDGTVSVRFYNSKAEGVYPNITYVKNPVDICVNKTVKKAFNGAHIYSSSSLWVQMVEKAYAKYLDTKNNGRYSANDHGFQRMNRGFSSDFLSAFDPDARYQGIQKSFGYSSDYKLTKDLYSLKAPKREGYTETEKELFNLFSRTNNGEIMTVGGTTDEKDRKAFMKDHGIRPDHAYAVMCTFEKDGKKYIQLRDPYATYEAKYNEKGELVNNSSFAGNTFSAGSNTMGTFNLEFKDFMMMFNSIPGLTDAAETEFRHLNKEVWFERNKQEEAKLREAEEQKTVQKDVQKAPEKKDSFDDIEIVEKEDILGGDKKPKKKDSFDDIEIVEKEDILGGGNKAKKNDFLDDAEIVDLPIKGKSLEDAKKELEKLQKDARVAMRNTFNNDNLGKEEKNEQLKRGLATMLTIKTVTDVIGKNGQYMDAEQLGHLLGKKSMEAAIVDTLESREFNKLCGDVLDSNLMLGAISNVNDKLSREMLDGAYKRLNEYTQEFAKKDLEAKQKKAAEKENVVLGPQ